MQLYQNQILNCDIYFLLNFHMYGCLIWARSMSHLYVIFDHFIRAQKRRFQGCSCHGQGDNCNCNNCVFNEQLVTFMFHVSVFLDREMSLLSQKSLGVPFLNNKLKLKNDDVSFGLVYQVSKQAMPYHAMTSNPWSNVLCHVSFSFKLVDLVPSFSRK